MRTPSRNHPAAGHPLRWSDVDEMYAGHAGLAAAVRALAPLTRDEATTLVASHQVVAAARCDLLPTTGQACVAIRGEAVVRAAATEAAAAAPAGVLRDGVTMLYELIAETAAADPAAAAGWLWGPTAPPLRSSGRLRRPTPPRRYAAHAAASGTTYDTAAAAAFEKATRARLEALAADGRSHLGSLPDTVAAVTAELAALRVHAPPAPPNHHSAAVAGRAAAGDPAAAARCAAASDVIRSAAVAAMAAARSVYVSNAAAMADPETAALEAIRAVGWVDAVCRRWVTTCPVVVSPEAYFSATEPSAGEFWLAAFTVARTQVGFAQQGLTGIAKALIGRP